MLRVVKQTDLDGPGRRRKAVRGPRRRAHQHVALRFKRGQVALFDGAAGVGRAVKTIGHCKRERFVPVQRQASVRDFGRSRFRDAGRLKT